MRENARGKPFQVLNENDMDSDTNSFFGSSEESDGSESDLTFDDVVREEFALLDRNREKRASVIGSRIDDISGEPRFSLAFSGGGVRAAAFEAGVLWRLGEAGCLKNVDHFAVVSGGSYIASAFASHIIAYAKPEDGDVDAWYLSIVAKTIERMQANIGYLLGDVMNNPCFVPRDGSRYFPRICDVPMLLCYIAFTLLYNPLTLFMMYLIPFTELVNACFGFYLRVALCNLREPNSSPTDEKFLERSPFVRYCVIVIFILLASTIVMNFSCWSIGQAWTYCVGARRSFTKARSRCPLFLWVTSAQAMLMRLVILLTILLALVVGLLLGEVGGGWQYHGSCAAYFDGVLSDRSGPGSVARCTDNFLFSMHPNATRCTNCFGSSELHSHTVCPDWCKADAPQNFTSIHQSYAWHTPGLHLLGYIFLVSLASLTLLVPFYGIKLLQQALMVLGPVVFVISIGCLFAYRIFGPITGQPLPYSDFGHFDDDTWDTMVRWCVFCGAVIFPLHPWLLSSMHTFYRRSLRRAFFHNGEDISWDDVGSNAFCPLLIMTGTVSDYKHPDYTHSTSEIFFSSAFMGGQKIGYVETPPWISVAKCMALTGAASDAAVLGVLSKTAYTFHRFWLDATNLRMGDNLLFDRNRKKAQLAFSTDSIETRAKEQSCQFEEGMVRCWDRMPTMMCSELVFVVMYTGLHLMNYESYCVAGRRLFFLAAAIQLVVYMLSFFAFVRCLECTLYSVFNKRAHMAMGYKHEAYTPPKHIYVTDGGVMDPSGILELLRRRCKRILLVQGVNDPKDELNMLKRTLALAESEHLACFYDPRDPMVSIEFVCDEFEHDESKTYLHIGIRYDAKDWQNKSELGQLFIVKLRLPDYMDSPVPPLLSEEEIIGAWEHDSVCNELGHLKQSELGGFWCSCCHRNGCNFGPKFPHLSNSNQFLTPELFSCICRLGYRLSEDAVSALCRVDQHEPSNINPSSLSRKFGTTPADLQRAEDRQSRYTPGFVC